MHILLLILFFVFLHRIIRLITRGGSYRRNPYGYRRQRFGGGLITILGLVALDRLFGNRRW